MSLRAIALFVLLLAAVVFAQQVPETPFSAVVSDEVIQSINGYELGLNNLAQYGNCSGANFAAQAYAAAGALINTFFHPDFQYYYVVQSTNSHPVNSVELNYYTGTASHGKPPSAPAPFPTSAALLAFTAGFYFGLVDGFFLQYPFAWLISAPIVTFKFNDAAFGGRTTAYVTLNDRNEGFHCAGTTPNSVTGYYVQFNTYNHVLAYNLAAGMWQIIGFSETTGSLVKFAQAPSVVSS